MILDQYQVKALMLTGTVALELPPGRMYRAGQEIIVNNLIRTVITYLEYTPTTLKLSLRLVS